MKCNVSCQCQDLYRKRALFLAGEPKTYPSLCPSKQESQSLLSHLLLKSGETENVHPNANRGWTYLKKSPEALEKQERNFHPSLPSTLDFPQAPWVLYPGEAQCEPRSIFTKSRALGWHTLTLGNISPLLFSLHLKEIQQCQESPWGTAIKDHFKNLAEGKLQGKEISDEAGSLGQVVPTHSASGGVGTVWIKDTCNSWKDSIKSSWAPHWFVKWWHCWVTCDLCRGSRALCSVSCLHCHIPEGLSKSWSWAGRGGHSQAQTFTQRCFYSIKCNSKDTKCYDSEPAHQQNHGSSIFKSTFRASSWKPKSSYNR